MSTAAGRPVKRGCSGTARSTRTGTRPEPPPAVETTGKGGDHYPTTVDFRENRRRTVADGKLREKNTIIIIIVVRP